MSESPTRVTTMKISGKVKRGLPFSRGAFSHDGKGDSKIVKFYRKGNLDLF